MKDAWEDLKQFTQARIAQGRAGCALTTQAALEFQLAHAKARDSIHQPWDVVSLSQTLDSLGLASMVLETAVKDRSHYLQRPDLGRQLNQTSIDNLQKFKTAHYDVVICLSNGLSSTAISQHGLGLLEAIITRFQAMNLTLGPICLAANARVALSDAIAEHLSSAIAIMMIGERPGLSADDSLGLYLTYQPGQDNTDANRNCISNIRPPEGLSYDMAAQKLAYLTQNAYRLGYSGVMLKDDMQQTENLPDAIHINSLAEDDRRSD